MAISHVAEANFMEVNTKMSLWQTLQTNTHKLGKCQRLRIGPGTLLAVVVAAAILYGQVMRPQPTAAGTSQIVYEADAQGHLRRVAAPTMSPTTVPPLWKPEISFLLDHDGELNLRLDQRKQMNTLNMAWLREKSALEQQINRAATDADTLLKQATPEHGAAPAMVASSLSDYSALSAEYDQRRAAYWAKAAGLLTPTQLHQLDNVRPSAGKRR